MKISIHFLFLLFIPFSVSGQYYLSGKIIDEKTNDPIYGATVLIHDLKKGIMTDSTGQFRIDEIPAGKYLLEVRFIGYESQLFKLDFTSNIEIDLKLKESHVELKEIIITGVSNSTEMAINPVASISLDKVKLNQTTATNIIDAISNEPGISQLSTGAGISKPIIRGLGFNRVLVLQNNIRQEGQQWGDEHGIEIDEFSIERVEIIKGPGSLAYGSDAMGGVINFLPADPISKNKQKLILQSGFQTNNRHFGNSIFYEGNKNDFYWNLQSTSKIAGNYQNKYDGKVFNSGFREFNGNGMIGLSRKWGYSQIHFSSFNQRVGIMEGERDSSGKFTYPIIVNDSVLVDQAVSENELDKNSLYYPQQQINHQRISWTGKIFKPNYSLQYALAWQQNIRREFELAQFRNELMADTAIHQILSTYNYDINYHRHIKEWESTLGLNGYFQKGKNAGSEYIIPEYTLTDFGMYLITARTFDKLHLSGGARFNFRKLASDELWLDSDGAVDPSDTLAKVKFESLNRKFSAFAWSGGLSYKFTDKIIGKLNISSGFRAPNIAELTSNGTHEGTFRYEKGNANLLPEKSIQGDAGISMETDHVSLQISGFYNSIDRFIYLTKLSSVSGNDSLIAEDGNTNKVYTFTQGNAFLYGGEISLDIHPHPFDWLHIGNSFSLVNAELKNATDSTKYLPFIPAPRLQTELRAEFRRENKRWSDLFFSITMQYNFEQNRFYVANNTETSTPSYTLFNAAAGFTLNTKKSELCHFIFSAQNLTDVAYQNHLSRLKYLSTNQATGRNGIYNMGRNFMVKIIFPVNF